MAWAPPGVEVNSPPHWPLARGEVNHVGDLVAVVIGDDRYAVADAVDDVMVEYEPLAAVVDAEAAIVGAPFVHEELGTNFGAHACVVDVDPETGKTTIVRYVAVDDCGNPINPINPINPMLIDGQIHGGVVFGIGQALYEQVAYDDDGQLVTGTFVNYALPTAAEVPSFETDRTVTPSPVNSMGVKGVGEAGTIAASAVVTNAVIDAIRPLGVDYMNMPLSPIRVWEAIQDASGSRAEANR